MRRSAAVVILVLLALSGRVGAAGSCTVTQRLTGNIRTVTVTCTADAAAATFPNTVLPTIEGRLLALVTDPGTTAPQDNYDVAVTDQYGADVLQGVGANRDTANTEKVAVVYSGTALHPPVDDGDVLTLAISGNNVNSATVVIYLYYALGG